MLNLIFTCGQVLSLALVLCGAYLSITNGGAFRMRVRLWKIRPAGEGDMSFLRDSFSKMSRRIGPVGHKSPGEGPATTASA